MTGKAMNKFQSNCIANEEYLDLCPSKSSHETGDRLGTNRPSPAKVTTITRSKLSNGFHARNANKAQIRQIDLINVQHKLSEKGWIFDNAKQNQ